MFIKDKFINKKPIISFEIFPPKKTGSIKKIYKTIEELAVLTPDYISVTYGAGGSEHDKTTEIASIIKNKYNIESLAHLTCINSNKKDIYNTLNNLENENIENILALKGDIHPDYKLKKDFNHASDLIEYIKENFNFCIGSAVYPEGHLEALNKSMDLFYTQEKINKGTDFLISQLFFKNKIFYEYQEKLKNRNIKVPLQAGIMPVVNKKQVEKIVSLCGTYMPEKFIKVMNKYENNKEALLDAGVTYACDQIIDLLSSDVDGIHLYVMNNPITARKIVERIKNILKYLGENNG
ncbi:5,10-methylenetetrahydrofolate reductase (NAD(P)) [Oceanotoga teriensis]|uniref:Methylenetetrahydrofolate reductase n=1 Tax=Oceanotoga teriensis TaxID=515440 RepID=A0AA45C913_9BACT|nr:methylenetetrahydrofolate reductase [NAD(P)H] [Oceanotoga teriensis]PWJ96544.1 5,10-methylenetetrahydrofolate reductase (NAD(P)) [Oceanotoga teriensis]